jgi:hypothetical protein
MVINVVLLTFYQYLKNVLPTDDALVVAFNSGLFINYKRIFKLKYSYSNTALWGLSTKQMYSDWWLLDLLSSNIFYSAPLALVHCRICLLDIFCPLVCSFWEQLYYTKSCWKVCWEKNKRIFKTPVFSFLLLTRDFINVKIKLILSSSLTNE